MSEGMDPEAIRTRSFATGRRGFDRDEVAAFQQEVASAVADLQERLGDLEGRLGQLGITELPDLKAEFDTVGEDVREILQAARDAAEDMRDRANADATTRLEQAQTEAEKLRSDAWKSSEQMLAQVDSTATEMSAKASEDVLFVRAEAEREALRMTGDAKRDAEEMVSKATKEAESLVQEARSESDQQLDTAQQSANLAQERVRALEQRREDLMAELEEARATLTDLEDTIEGRKSELIHATTDPSESSVRILTEDVAPKADIDDWLDEDATVRLLPPALEMPMDPVDADELVAEVESLRSVPNPSQDKPDLELVTGGSASSSEVSSLDFEITSGDAPAVADSSATAEVVAPVAAPSEASADEVAVDDDSSVKPEESVSVSVSQPGEGGGLDDLFASLRTPGDAVPASSTAVQAPASDPTVPVTEVTEAEQTPTVETATGLDDVKDGPWELRDRMLVPVTNEMLRGIKREIVDLQNAVLEELRTESDEWRPKKAMFDSLLGPDAATVAVRSYKAGIAASGELRDVAAPEVPVKATHTLASLVTDLWEAVVDAIESTADNSSRERAASVGRIFRAWRTDEAERRVRQVAHAEYNAGVAAGFDELGVSHVMDPHGRDLADPDATVIPVV